MTHSQSLHFCCCCCCFHYVIKGGKKLLFLICVRKIRGKVAGKVASASKIDSIVFQVMMTIEIRGVF